MMFIKKHEKGKRLHPVDDTKVLGIPWNTSRHTFSFTIQYLLHAIQLEHITKKHSLQFSESLCNPLGILSPAMLALKVMF